MAITSCHSLHPVTVVPFHIPSFRLGQAILGRGEDFQARGILAWCKFLDGDHGAAAGEFCAAMSAADDPKFLEEVWVGRVEMVGKTGRLR